MSFVLHSIVAFLIALGILVTVHEFGHFWVARKLGVKVLRFSVGFGRPLLRWQRSESATEYVIAALPLGGYVKMLDEREGEVAGHERHLAFNTQPVWKRIAIVVAGPFANILLAIAFYSLVMMIGIFELKPVVGGVVTGSVAEQAGFQYEDEIIGVGQKPTATWQQVQLALLDELLERHDFAVDVIDASGVKVTRHLQLQRENLLQRDGEILDNVGLKPWFPKLEPVVQQVSPGSAAEKAGVQAQDRIVRIDGAAVSTWDEMADIISAHPERQMHFQIRRDDRLIEFDITPDKVERDGRTIGLIGVAPHDPQEKIDAMRVLVQYPVHQAVMIGAGKSWDMSVLLLRTIGALVTGQASVKNISGPITIAEVVGRSANIGLSYYLEIIAFVSISLAVLNLLPVPLLDGGHLLYYVIELIKGSPVSDAIQEFGQRIGFALLAGLMLLAFYNDITRLLLR